MNVLENIRVALRALSANKVRSALTMLGIIIGVGAVVALLSLGQGASQMITGQVEDLGSNLIMVTPARMLGDALASQQAVLYYSDYELIARNVPGIENIAPIYQSYKPVKYGDKTSQYTISGVTPIYAQVLNYQVDQGRFISRSDGSSKARVAVLGSQTAEDLFGNVDPIGRRIQIGEISFDVVGVLASKGSTGFSFNDTILIPLETGYSRLFGSAALENGQRTVSSITVSAAQADTVSDVMARIKFLLRKQHDLAAQDESDFLLTSQDQFLDILDQITGTLTTFLAAIAGISLLVGGIGIMNIMLVSVTERTREIGIRMALGARRRDIQSQFLIEALTLSVIGGFFGVLVGLLISAGIGKLAGWGFIFDPGTIAIATVFSLAVGIVFGVWPARQAARLDPVVALRFE
jgi:putative ABC transport system permease protein